MRRELSLFLLFTALTAGTLLVLGTRLTGLPPFGALLDPVDGLYRTARQTDRVPPSQIRLPGLSAPVRVAWDLRRVPHVFAETDLDAVAALGYVVARDRLFQMDFIGRAASGRLAEALGPAAVPADRFLRSTGMERGARRNLERIRRADGEELALLDAYCRGVNAYLRTLDWADLPFEFRLLGYRPDACTPLLPLRVLQYMNYDLTYRTDDAGYGLMKERLGEDAFRLLYPAEPRYSVPIVPSSHEPSEARESALPAERAEPALHRGGASSLSSLLEGYRPGKGSNNWAVYGERSSTGRPILAGDVHLSVTLPAIWYEVHLVTPEMNVYGVTVPGAPVPIEAFTENVAWAFTNTAADQIDHYRLDVDSSTRTYRFEGARRRLEAVPDTILVNRSDPIVDTLYYSHWGPVVEREDRWTAVQWTAHDTSRTLAALWEMNHARHHADFQAALRKWDTPMQNILYADREGTVSMRSTGYLPVRSGGTGAGLLDGSSRAGAWIGRVPFEELPFAVNPERGYLTSTNQKPTDAAYPHYLGHDWGRTYRSIRIDTLLRRQSAHSPADLRRYQADVHAVQRDFFVPLLDTLGGLAGRAEALRDVLSRWDGEMGVDRREPIVLHFFLDALAELTWDEDVFGPQLVDEQGNMVDRPIRPPRPDETSIYYLLTEVPSSAWLDLRATPLGERAPDLLRAALDTAAARLERRYGSGSEAWRWGRRHRIRFNHLIGGLAPLGRGPFEYPGYDETLSPGADTLVTHSASWRMVVDFAGPRPRGAGVYPGGQSGDPFSRFYDLHLPAYLGFEYYDLLKPRLPSDLGDEQVLHRSELHPSAR